MLNNLFCREHSNAGAPASNGKPNRPHLGFTLIELLVVIAIIGLLAAILFPVFGRARENARRSSCLSNMKQVGLGMLQYTQDFDEMYPPVIVGERYPVAPTSYSWAYAIKPYVKSDQVYKCPSETIAAAVQQDFAPGMDVPRSYYPIMQYWDTTTADVNSAVMKDYNAGTNIASIPNVATTIWLTESGSNAPYTNTNLIISNHGLFVFQRNEFNRFGKWHFDGTVMAFADGHVKWMKPESAVNMTDTSKDLFVRNKA